MPVTAKLSRKFYEVFGDELTNELVDWFNAVDATYRADLDRLNELNFQRFDATVEQRFAEADAKLERRLAAFRAEVDRQFTALRAEMAGQRADLIKWMFVFWTGTLIPLAGLMIALQL